MSNMFNPNFASYTDFRSHLNNLDNKAKGDAFEQLAYFYLTLHPTYTTKLKSVWRWHDVPSSTLSHLGLPAQDLGIDILAETLDGTFWAVQCKYISDEEHSIGHEYISTFTSLAFGVCKQIEFALLCTTADRFSSKLAMYEGRLGILAGDVWRGLDTDFFAQIQAVLAHKQVKPKPKEPRPHQIRAIENAKEYFADSENRRGKLIMPCGTGKSLTGYWIADVLGANKVLVALPSLSLIRQTLEVWTREAVANGKVIEWLVVCSDDSVSESEADDVTVLTQDLGIAVDTDIRKISAWLSGNHQKRTVVFTTYQSGKVTAAAVKEAGYSFELGIFDEAHKTVGGAGTLFSHLLYEKNISINRRIFMTATERYYRGNSENIASMDNIEIYGEDFEVLSFKEALTAAPPILCDYKIITILVGHSEIASLIKQNILISDEDGKAVEAEMLTAMVALQKAMEKYPIKHAVSFHSSIKRARTFKEITAKFTDNSLDTFHVSGKTPTAKRAQMIGRFSASPKALITNARCLTEGVDVPNIDAVLFANPRKSVIDIVQAVGRALRTYEGKEYGYVIVPVMIDGENLEESEAGAYDAVIAVLKALAANDERIVDYFRDIGSGRVPTTSSPLIIEGILGGVSLNIDEFARAVELKIWDSTKRLGWRPFEQAREFVRSLGLKSENEWRDYTKNKITSLPQKPDDIPVAAGRVYKEMGWKSMGDWLGTGRVADQFKKYRDFEGAKKFVYSLGLKSKKEWDYYCKGMMPHLPLKPDDIPTGANKTYKNKGWKNWGDWLGTGRVADHLKQYRDFEDARKFVHSLGLKSSKEWRLYCKGKIPHLPPKPNDIPANPDSVYKNKGWKSSGDWLGTGKVATYSVLYRDFEQAREFAHSLGLKSQKEWSLYCKGMMPHLPPKPDDISSHPNQTYKNKGWKSSGDWLGTGRVADQFKQYRKFEQAREFVHSLGLKSRAEWSLYCKGKMPHLPSKPDDIPIVPDSTYKHSWTSWGDWLGTGRIAARLMDHRDFEDAKKFVHSLGLKSQTEWHLYCKGQLPHFSPKPDDIPTNPHRTYKDNGWKGTADWLGTAQNFTQNRTVGVEDESSEL